MKNLVEYIENSAQIFPDKTAIRYEDEGLSYGELREKARKIASGIVKLDSGETISPVAVFLPRGIEPVVCYLGVLYSGHPYVPMNYSLPDNRLKSTFETLKPVCVITDEENSERIRALCNCEVVTPDELLQSEACDGEIDRRLKESCDCDPAYIMFTSGSTGSPKGVTISHRGVIDYVDSMLCEFDISEKTVIGMQSPLYFDISVFDMYVSFCKGCELVIIPDKIFMFPKMIPEYVNDKGINLIYWVPTVFDSLVKDGILDETPFKYVDTVIFAGEAMHNSTLNVLRRTHPKCSFTNLYGPTETSVISMIYKVDRAFRDDEPLPIGTPCKNSRAFIVDENGKEITADGKRGEIVLGGIGVGLGYWNNKEISDKAFVQSPLNDKFFERVYRTGDIGYYKDGLMMFAGRADSQIKHRGNRIELADIECAASSVEGIHAVCALYDNEKQEIVIFAESEISWNLRKFNLELKKLLPPYMMPSRLYLLEEMPHTPNGKIDRVTLKKKLTEEI